MASFSSAFRSARAAGKKKFTWNGKSYTTELATSSAPKASARPKVKPVQKRTVTETRSTGNVRNAVPAQRRTGKLSGIVNSTIDDAIARRRNRISCPDGYSYSAREGKCVKK